MATGGDDPVILVNTGFKEKKQIDRNPRSPTYGQARWVDAGIDYTACPLPLAIAYQNSEHSSLVFKTDCPPLYEGTSVLFTVPAGMFTSYVSQAEADQRAFDYMQTQGQIYANANATCVKIALPPADTGGGGSGGVS